MASYGIYTGRWTDWSKGSVLGDQITLTRNDSNILIAAIALINTFAGTIAWRLLSYHLHHIQAKDKRPEGPFFHQIQMLLRNSATPVTFAHNVMTGAWNWRKHWRRSEIVRSVGLVIAALSIFMTFTMIGLLLSKISTTGAVLLRSNGCGKLKLSDMPLEQRLHLDTIFDAQVNRDVNSALTYATTCYQDKAESIEASDHNAPASNCEFYINNALKWNTSYHQTRCPFQGLCAVDPITLDTGYLDSNDDIGFNSEPKDRIKIRRVTTCAPIDSSKYSTGGFVHDPELGYVAKYNFGPDKTQRTGGPWTPRNKHSTFVYGHDSYTAQVQAYEMLMADSSGALRRKDGSLKKQFFPSPDIYQGDHTLILLFLANRAIYLGSAIPDPWFNASTVVKSSEEGMFSYSKIPGNIMACEEKVELCNPAIGGCSPGTNRLVTKPWAESSFPGLHFNDVQNELAKKLVNTMNNAGFGAMTMRLASGILEANDYLSSKSQLTSMPIPLNQWMREVQRMQAVSLAYVQRLTFAEIGGYIEKPLFEATEPYTDPVNQYLCKNLKIRNTSHTTFPVLGLVLIFGLDGIVVLAASFTFFLLPKIQRYLGKAETQRRRWAADSQLQLQRGLFHALGLGTWDGKETQYPVSKGDEIFCPLTDIRDTTSELRGWVEKTRPVSRSTSTQDSLDEKISIQTKIEGGDFSPKLYQTDDYNGGTTSFGQAWEFKGSTNPGLYTSFAYE